jgi:hypothetical protein
MTFETGDGMARYAADPFAGTSFAKTNRLAPGSGAI